LKLDSYSCSWLKKINIIKIRIIITLAKYQFNIKTNSLRQNKYRRGTNKEKCFIIDQRCIYCRQKHIKIGFYLFLSTWQYIFYRTYNTIARTLLEFGKKKRTLLEINTIVFGIVCSTTNNIAIISFAVYSSKCSQKYIIYKINKIKQGFCFKGGYE